ncbi:MAG: glycosyltransferase, partial [Oscillospiraceae bacterium]|nr:glycosyltransferase [Oscillospiraceae bacterium]
MKILMATNGLDIGGAETHVVELAKELKRRGHDIVVVSAGGVYVKELEGAGIRHIKAPLNSRTLGPMVQSYRVLKKAIREEKPDVVHAHARIPGFLCGLLHKGNNFAFVTSAHWVFASEGMVRYLTNWGQKTIAVSEDIKQYLKENYGVPGEDVTVTINGIDTDRFAPEISGQSVKEEFGIPEGVTVLSHVSRMDDSRALAARYLIDLAPALCEQVKGLTLLLVGGGDVLEELKVKAEEQNRKIGRRAIIMTGARSDINSLVAAGDIFVGVSRAALEAMSAAKPTLVAGNEGYLGIFGPDKLERAIETNFCCRGDPPIDGETMKADVLRLLNMTG